MLRRDAAEGACDVTPVRKSVNPFNVVLLAIGCLFVITVCGYSVLAVKGTQPYEAQETTAAGRWLLDVLDKHGFAALMTELVLLALTTFAAIRTDAYWTRRASETGNAGPPAADQDSPQDIDGPVI